ncbi:40s ribosomal protein s13 [Phlyctema vagabunda]|uniref:40s ribosomal protein s13 n=1 Tax=Phlyctema vagabunda TaxID=108571 RepID=A0ABR4P4G6_9HELO
MVFLFFVNFQEQRMLKTCLETFYGLGNQHSSRLMAKFCIHPTARVGSISPKTILDLNAELSTMTIESDLRRQLHDNLLRLRDMGSYRGRRHAMNLPVRGQNTRNQNMTARKLNKINRKG